ncbi:MAG: lamin tail domain-containing protein [Pirellulales bacterium]
MRKRKRVASERLLKLESLEPRLVLSADPYISEFLAVNHNYLADKDGAYSDWIEVFNPDTTTVNLNGWHLTDDAALLEKWTFPSVDVAPGGYLVVFASDKNLAVAGSELHTNFKLSSTGEYLALVKPDGTTVASQFAPGFPEQYEDISYGIGQVVTEKPLVSAGAADKVLVPVDGSLGSAWTGVGYNDADWTAQTRAPSIVISEAGTASPDNIEITNVSGQTVNTAGWIVALNNGQSGDINSVVSTYWNLPGSISAGADRVQYRTDSNTENYFGTNIPWSTNGNGWAMVLDNTGALVDFVAWGGYTAAQIAAMAPVVNAKTITIGSKWTGDAISAAGGSQANGLQRIGSSDHDNASDFVWAAQTRGLPNANLATAFPATAAGTTGIGYQTMVPGFAVSNYKANVTVGSLATAESVLATPTMQSGVVSANDPTVNYIGSGGGANFAGDQAFPGAVMGADIDDFVILASATVTIPAAGDWTFGVNSDDGFSLSVGTFQSSFPNPRGPADTLATFNFAAPGDYALRLVMYERGGGSEVELYAAQGSFASYGATNTWRLVGDTANGGLAVMSQPVSGGSQSGYRGVIGTNVESAMFNRNASAYLRVPFTVANPAAYDSLTLRMKYDDGFVAYLNGYEIARRNAPASPAYNSPATASRTNAQALAYEEIDVTGFLNRLVAGANVLAIQGLNETAGDNDFLIVPELVDIDITSMAVRYFATPTPGAPNEAGFAAFVADTKFSQDRGFYDAPFDLTITTETPGAVIRYTTDGSAPTETNGLVYDGPITISKTTTLRAAAFKTDYRSSLSDTQTYIFLDDVIRQPSTPQPPLPTSWGANVVDYGMDPDVVNNPIYAATIENDLKAIPTYSIVADLNDLFGPVGIYSNPGGDEMAWERPASVELINPDGTPGFQSNIGLRIRGGYSRSTGNPKHAFHIFFRDEYGNGELDYPVFGPDGAQSYKRFDLRCAQNYSWSFAGDSRGIFIRDQFSRDTQLAMGQPGERGDFVHLYINGQYWGLYNTAERPSGSIGASYFGGVESDYDLIKVDADLGYQLEATDGTMDAWNAMWAQVVAGLGTMDAYQKIQGKNPDGSPNPAYANLLDVDNLIDYMLTIFYTGNFDAPLSAFLGDNNPNNIYALRNRNGNEGFRFYAHDSEHTLLLGGTQAGDGLTVNRTGPFLDPNTPSGSMPGVNKSNPQWIFDRLSANPEFRLRVADRIQKHFSPGGAFYVNPSSPNWDPAHPENNLPAARFMARKDEIDQAVVAESARWGDAKRGTPLTRDVEWIAEINRLVAQYFPQRTGIVLNQLIADGMVSSIGVPAFNQQGGTVSPGFNLTITAATGTIYYTDDGSDPRLPGGAISPTAKIYTGAIPLAENRLIKARALSGGTWSAVNQATFIMDNPPPLRITEIMYNPAAPPVGSTYLPDDFEFIELKNVGAQTINLNGVQFTQGITFNFSGSAVTSLTPGQFVLVVKNQTAFATRYNTAGMSIAGEYTGQLNNAGDSLKLEANLGQPILDFSYADGWYDQTDGHGFSLAIMDASAARDTWSNKASWRPSAFENGSPGADDPLLVPSAESVLINEALTHTDQPTGDWIELWNTNAGPIDIGGWYLSDDASNPAKYHIAAGTTIPGGGYRVFNQATQFGNAADPGTNVVFGLSELGDEVYLTAGQVGGALLGYQEKVDFGAADKEVTFGRYTKSTGGTDFVALSASTSGAANAYPKVGPVVINELMYDPGPGGDEFIELLNTSGADVPLYDPANPANTWQLRDAVDFVFPTGTSIAANGYVLIVPIDPAAFRAKYGIPAAVPVLGPYTGNLDNAGEPVELYKPGDPEPIGTVPYVRVDRVNYNDKAPWPLQAAGLGSALNRIVPTNYGNDVANWAPSTAGGTPGSVNRSIDNTPPTAPSNLVATPASGTRIDLAWNAASDPESNIYYYKIYRDGIAIGTSTTTTYRSMDLDEAATYSFEVAAVNYDNLEGPKTAPVTATPKPTLDSASVVDSTHLAVRFGKPVVKALAETVGNYAINGITIASAALAADNTTVTLTLSAGTPLVLDTPYTLTVNNVQDLSGNAIQANSQANFVYVAWSDQDIGAVNPAGSMNFANGAFTIQGSGADIWGTADAFHYVYRPLVGDGELVARVASLTNPNVWAKAGVMIRETLAANSRHAMTVITPGNGVSFQRRLNTGGQSEHTTTAGPAAPYWVRIVRQGNNFSSYSSLDGQTWALNGTVTIAMTTNAYIGLAVTSHAPGTLATAVIDNVTFVPPDTTGPAVADVLDVAPDPRNIGLATVDVDFSEPINLSTFTYADLTLTCDGAPVALTSAVTTSQVAGNTYRISGLTTFTATQGTYVLSVSGAGVQDIAGNAGSGSASDTWVVDTTAPSLVDVVDVAPDPRTSAVATVDVTFSKAIHLATFTFADLTLVRDGGLIPLTSDVTVSLVSASTYRVSGLGGFTAVDGTYTLTVYPSGIRDLAGNVATGSGSDTWSLVSTPPAVQSHAVNNGAAQRSAISTLAIQFSEDVTASLDNSDLTLRNDTAAAQVNLAGVTPTYNPAINTATWNLAGVALADGYYTATLAGAGVTNASGVPLAGNYAFQFFRLQGDTDGSASVDIFDVAALQPNYGQTTGMTPDKGDFDGNGTVDIFDVAILQTQYCKTLTPPAPMPAAAPPADAALAPPADANLVTQTRVVSSEPFSGFVRAGAPFSIAVAGKTATPAARFAARRASVDDALFGANAGQRRDVYARPGSAVRAVPGALGDRLAARAAWESAIDRIVESDKFEPSKWHGLADL